LANHPSALKRARQNLKRREQNRAAKTRMKNIIKTVRSAVDEKSKETALKELNSAKSLINKTARKGIIHRNTAARKISRLSKLVNQVA
jgi:small subunit ribosomal protein S20